MKIYIISVSTRKDKKLMFYEINNIVERIRVSPIIHFGASEYDDYTSHKDKIRRDMYLMRHEKNEDWNDLSTAGAWSRWIIWNKPSLKGSIIYIIKILNIKIII